MKKYILIGLMAVLLFGLSAAGSWMWRQQSKSHAEEGTSPEATTIPHTESTNKGSAHGAVGQSGPATGSQRTAVRPPYTPGADEAIQLASNLREQKAALREREAQLAAREKQLKLIYDDIRGERVAVDELRKQVGDELKAVKEKMDAADKKLVGMEQEHQKMMDKGKQMKESLVEVEESERRNIEKMAKMYAGMTPESAAKVLQQMADTGKMETAVKVLGQMQERQAAKILSELPEAVTAQLLEKMKSLKRTSTVGATPTKP